MESIKPVTTAGTLRILADQLDKGESTDFVLIMFDEEGNVITANKSTDDLFKMLGALSSMQFELNTYIER